MKWQKVFNWKGINRASLTPLRSSVLVTRAATSVKLCPKLGPILTLTVKVLIKSLFVYAAILLQELLIILVVKLDHSAGAISVSFQH